MSNYSQIILYGPKDSLALNDTNKYIKGVQIDAELGAIATAIATKLDTPVKGLSVGSNANSYAQTITSNTTTGQSYGLNITAGTNSSDTALAISSATGNNLLKIGGDGTITAGSPATSITPNSGSFVGQFTGYGSTLTSTCNWYKIGQFAVLQIGAVSGTSTSTSFTLSNVPSAIIPPTTTQVIALSGPTFTNNGGQGTDVAAIITTGTNTLSFLNGGSSTAWTASGTKGFSNSIVLSWMVV